MTKASGLASLAVVVALACPSFARAEPAETDAPVTPVGEEAAPAPSFEPGVRRPFLYVDDPTLPAPWRVVATSALSLTSGGGSPTRPFASNVAHPGGAYELGAEVGLARRVAFEAAGVAGGGGAVSSTGASFGMIAGLRVALVDDGPTRLTLSAGYLRELEGASGAFARVAFAEDLGRLRLAVTAHGEHVFARARDGVDVMLLAGASVAVAGPVRAGVEYVAQDLEGAVDHEEAEQGVRHFVGPNAQVELLGGRLLVTAGPAVGLSSASPSLLGRAAVAYVF